MIADPFAPFSACYFRLKHATEAWERKGAHTLRRQIFCDEQAVFKGDDRDAIDDAAIHLVALTSLGILSDEVAGTVRIHQPSPGIWWGSRLAVDRRYRGSAALGAGLIKLAVSSANGLGCQTFYAHVQAQNELLFRRLRWQRIEEVELHGKPHVLMQADLSYYPPLANAQEGFHALEKRKAA